MQHSQHHIDGWLTDYECLTDLEAVNDVKVLSPLFKGYTGEGVTKDEWGMLRLKTIEEVGLSDHKMVMNKILKVLWYIIISAMVITIFILVSSKVLAHDEGQCLTDVDGNVRRSNGGWVKVIEHLRGADLKEFVHGHRHQYYDRHGNPTGQTTNFWSIYVDGDDSDYLADCPTTTVDRPTTTPIRQSSGETHIVDSFVDRPTTTPIRQSSGAMHLLDSFIDCPTVPSTTTPRAATTTAIPRATTTDDSDYVGAGDACHTWDFTVSPYIGFPVLPDGVETIGGFRSYLHKRIKEWVKIALLIDGQWQWYPTNDELKYTLITPHLGVYVSYRDSDLEVCGEHPVTGESVEFTVPEGDRGAIFLVGIPEVPANYEMRSDLLINNLTWLKRKVWVGDYKNTENEYVSRQRRADDTEIKPGQAFMIRVTGDVNLNLGGNVPAAPSAQRISTLALTWGAMKQ